MTTLKIQGSDKKIKQLARELKVRASRTGLEMSLTESKKVEVCEGTELKAKEVIELVGKVKTLKDLVQYESDKRATVVAAIEAKRAELSKK